MTLWLRALQLSHHPTKFCGHRHRVSGDIIVLVFHMILQVPAIKELYDFQVSYYPAKFGGHSHSDSGVIMILVCQVISQGCN